MNRIGGGDDDPPRDPLADDDAPYPTGHWAPTVPFAGIHLAAVPDLDSVQALNDDAAAIWNALCRKESVDGAAAKECIAAWERAGLFRRYPGHEPMPPPPEPASWALDRVVALFGRRIRVAVATPWLAASLEEQLAPCSVADPAHDYRVELIETSGGYVLVEDGTPRAPVQDALRARGSVVNALLQIGRRHGDWLGWLHGGCVADGEHAWLVLGTSGSGKSTLVASLVADGRQLVADDVVPLEVGLQVRVVPVPLAASVKSGSRDVLAGSFPSLASAREHVLGLRRVRYLPLPAERRAGGPLPVAALLFPRWSAGAEFVVEPLTPLDVLARLTDGSSWLDLSPRSLRSLARWIETTPAFALRYATTAQARQAFERIAASVRRGS